MGIQMEEMRSASHEGGKLRASVTSLVYHPPVPSCVQQAGGSLNSIL